MNTDMKKQTAVEWLECELKKIPFINVIEVFNQAKAMEKEQIEDAYDEGHSDCFNGEHKQYYYETYGGDK